MLGFGSVGRYALGQLPTSQSFTMTATVASFILNGVDANMNATISLTKATFSYSGVSAPLNPALVAGAGGYILSGLQVTFISSFRRPLYLRGSYWRGAR